MSILDIILITLSLSIDNFAVSAASSCSGGRCGTGQILKVAAVFSFVGIICLIGGYYGGVKLQAYISSWDHILGPLLLFYIGAKMIKGAWGAVEGEASCQRMDMRGLKVLFALAIATNIDVLAAGISIAIYNVSLVTVGLFLVFFISFAVCLGFTLGSRLGRRFGSKVEIVGGIVLILLSIRIFLEG